MVETQESVQLMVVKGLGISLIMIIDVLYQSHFKVLHYLHLLDRLTDPYVVLSSAMDDYNYDRSIF